MTEAVEIESGQPWRVEYGHGIEGDGLAGQTELANGCAMVWIHSIKLYYADANAAYRELKQIPDKGEALEDLLGDRRLLDNLCQPLEADSEVIGDAMLDAIDAGRRFDVARMNRAVPEIHEDYGTWSKSKRKTRSPWRETGGGIGLGKH